MFHEISHPIVQILFSSTLILLAAFFTCVFSGKRTPSFRHAVWTVAMLGLLLLPLVLPLLPRISLEIFPPQSKGNSVAESGNTLKTGVENRPEFSETQIPGNSGASSPELVFTDAFPYPAQEKTANHLDSPASRSEISYSREVFPAVVFFTWLGVALLRIVQLGRSHVSAGTLLRKTREVQNPEIREFLSRLCDRLKISTPVQITIHPETRIPFALGIFRPVIVLPPHSENWNREEREAILTHELSHIARRDTFWQLLAQTVSALYWFHPLVWFGIWRMRVERELACDDAVLHHGGKARDYAGILLELAAGVKRREPRRVLPNCAIAMARYSPVKERILDILDPNRNRKPLGRKKLGVFTIFSALILTVLCMISPMDSKAVNQEKSDEERKWEIALEADEPEIQISGRVVFPEDAPDSRARISVVSNFYVREDHPHTSLHRAESNFGANEDGRFEISVKPGSNVILEARSIFDRAHPDKPQFVSEAFVFSPRGENEPITLRMHKGIPVGVSARYESGAPASGEQVEFSRIFAPLIGEEFENMRECMKTQHICTFNEQGNLTTGLFPGEYRLKLKETLPDRIEKEKILHVKADADNHVEFTFPDPVFLQLLEDGKPYYGLFSILGVRGSDSEPQVFIEGGKWTHENGIRSVFVNPGDQLCVLALTKDGASGINRRIPTDAPGNRSSGESPHQLELEPTAEVKIRLVLHESGEPISHANLRITVESFLEEDSPGGASTASIGLVGDVLTDTDGFAVFRVPVLDERVEGIRYKVIPPGTIVEKHAAGYTRFTDAFPFRELRRGEITNLGVIEITDWKPEKSEKPLAEPVPQKNDAQIVDPERIVRHSEPEIPADGVLVGGRVFLPDGSPGKNLFLAIRRIRLNGDVLISVSFTDEQGNYSFHSPEKVGSYFAVMVRSQQGDSGGQLPYASPFLGVKIEKDMKSDAFDLRLSDKGTLLHGKLTYENGEPAASKRVNIAVYPLGKEEIRFVNGHLVAGEFPEEPKRSRALELKLEDWVQSDENGEYRVLLQPGLYKISQADRFDIEPKTLEIREGQQEHRLDLLALRWTGGEVFLEDGSPAKDVKIRCCSLARENFFSFNDYAQADSSGRFSLPLTRFGNLLLFHRKDKSQGIVVSFPNQENDSGPLEITMQKPEKAKLRLLDQDTGEPLANTPVRYEVEWAFNKHDSSIGCFYEETQTDAQGFVELPNLYCGGTYRVGLIRPQSVAGFADRVSVYSITPKKPGETVDYGEVFVDRKK